MDKSKENRHRLGLTIIITSGATYILSILVGSLLMNVITLTMPMVLGIKLVIALVIGFAVWNILKGKGQMPDN